MKKFLFMKTVFFATFIILISFVKTSYALPLNQWVKVNNDWYYVGQAGNFLINSWVEYQGQLYHLSSDGKMDKSKWIDNTFYVDIDGKMLRNTTTPDGYFVDSMGRYVNNNINTNAPTSNIINATTNPNRTNTANEPPSVINNPSAPTQNTTSGSSKNGFHVTYKTATSESEYYDENKFKTYIKIVRPEITYDGWMGSTRKEKLEELNEIIDNLMDEHYDTAVSLAENGNIKRYTIDKCKISRAKSGELVLLFEGNIRNSNNNNSPIKFYLHYNYYYGDHYISNNG